MDSLLGAVHGVAQGHAFPTAGSAVLLGVLFHLAIRPIEFEFYMFHFMAAYAGTFLVFTYALGFTSAFLLAAGFNTGVLSSIGIYRLVFHRCRKFPGPFPAKLSKFYAASLSAKDVQFYKELANLHGQYGDFVRTGEKLAVNH
jgi:hypothetical protein